MIVNHREKRTVLITGATSDIGSAIALRFAEKGWNVICHYNSSWEKAEILSRKIMNLNVDCQLIRSDFSSQNSINRLLNNLNKYRIDSLLNNAGSAIVNKYFNELAIGDLQKTFMVNVFAPMLLSSKLFINMIKRGFGRIVNISSISAKYGGSDNSMHYGCSKRALEGITKTLARNGSMHNVLVNTIRPGVIDTDFHKKFPKDMKKRIKMIPMKKMGFPKDIADMAFLLGSDNNNFITNEIITISGGE